jgi:hypothetical protein
MSDFDINKAFDSDSENVLGFFQRPGVGFHIPLYQREYSWDKEDIDQLMEDVFHGVKSLSNHDNSSIIHFLGTVIVVPEKHGKINLGLDPKAIPETIYNVIDGQQRISTLALISCLLYEKLYNYQLKCNKKVDKDPRYSEVVEAVDKHLSNLIELFSFDLVRGTPNRKPIIIRGDLDKWTYEGKDQENYKSDVSLFVAKVIRVLSDTTSPKFPKIEGTSLVSKNLRKIKQWLKRVENAHNEDYDENDDELFLPATQIIENIQQDYLWNYERTDLTSLVKESDSTVCSLVQLMAFNYYLLQRCCFTRIKADSEEWAFDMFQSLNATGTPLTAIETFKPLVVNSVKSSGSEFKGSEFGDYFSKIDQLFYSAETTPKKNKLTNYYLSLLGATYGEKRPSRQFSAQIKWLTEKYKELKSIDEKKQFIRQMAELAQYWQNVVQFKPNEQTTIPEIGTVTKKEREKAELCVVYLQSANHYMANAVLGRFYSLCLRNIDNADQSFVSACQAVAAFYTLWRSAFDNTGLDDVYRKLLQKEITWNKNDSEIVPNALKNYFRQILKNKKIGTKEEWISKAINRLTYNEAKVVCKFALMISAEDTILDEEDVGLMKIGSENSYSFYLNPHQWFSRDLETIEHIAPQQPPTDHNWDEELYKDESYEKIGNLTLLPININSSASNKTWIEKWIYYKHLAEKDPNKIEELRKEAETKGIKLKDETIDLLGKSSYSHHILPIIQLGSEKNWDKKIVDKRTKRICEILWERMWNQWLS